MEKLDFHKYRMREVLRISSLVSAHYFFELQNYSTPAHIHEDAWEFVYCAAGEVRTYQNRTERVLMRHQITFHPLQMQHHLCVDGEKTNLLVISFVCSSEVIKLLQNRTLYVNQVQRRMLSVIIQELANAFELQDGNLQLVNFRTSPHSVLGAEQMIRCFLEGFLIGLLRDVTNQSEHRWDAVALERTMENRIASDIKAYVEAHLGERITLDILSEHVHYSRSYVNKQFRRSMGMSVAAYISERRIEQAKQYLLEKTMNVSQIAEQLGFSSVQYFSKCFKDAVGCSPSSYAGSPRV